MNRVRGWDRYTRLTRKRLQYNKRTEHWTRLSTTSMQLTTTGSESDPEVLEVAEDLAKTCVQVHPPHPTRHATIPIPKVPTKSLFVQICVLAEGFIAEEVSTGLDLMVAGPESTGVGPASPLSGSCWQPNLARGLCIVVNSWP